MKRAIGLILLYGTACFAQPVSSTDLINKARDYDGRSVLYEGEVIGDIMSRGDSAWANVNDGENAVGIWLSKESVGEILFTGGYHAKGDRLQITGVFHRGCPEHGGDMDIHAQAIRKTMPGELVAEEFDTGKRNFTFVMLGILGVVLIFARRPRSKPSGLRAG